MKKLTKEQMWTEYAKNRTPELREQLILEYAPLVKIVAGKLSMYLGHNVEYEDLTSYGIFGLIDAIDKFDVNKDVKFETYASLRIRGEILDQIRKMDWIPRTVRQKQKKIDEAIRTVESRTGKVASDKVGREGLRQLFERWSVLDHVISNASYLYHLRRDGSSRVYEKVFPLFCTIRHHLDV